MADGIAGSTTIPVSEYSELQASRLAYVPTVPAAFAMPAHTAAEPGDATVARVASDEAALRSWFPRTFGQPIVNFTSNKDAAIVKGTQPVGRYNDLAPTRRVIALANFAGIRGGQTR